MESTVDRDTVRLWRVYKTIHQLVHDRGYVVSQAELETTLSEFIQTFGAGNTVADRAALNFVVQKRDDPNDQLFVFFPDDLSVGVKPIRGYLERMNEQGVYRAIVVVRQSMTPSAAKVNDEGSACFMMAVLGDDNYGSKVSHGTIFRSRTSCQHY
jgi:DNA-directed RNA polymerase I, II, and III subunit RPABC1